MISHDNISNKSKTCTKDTESKKSIYNIIKSSSVHSIHLLLLNEQNIKSNELCTDGIEPIIKNYEKWIWVVRNPEYLKIIYYLVINGICHISGFSKVFGGDGQNLKKIIERLRGYGILEIADKDGDVKKFYIHRKIFRMDDYHYKRAIFYRLTYNAKIFYGEVPFEKFLQKHYIKLADNWRKQLTKKHNEIKLEEKSIVKIKKIWFNYIIDHRKDCTQSENKSWFEGQIELLEKNHGIIIKQSAEEILDEFNQKIMRK